MARTMTNGDAVRFCNVNGMDYADQLVDGTAGIILLTERFGNNVSGGTEMLVAFAGIGELWVDACDLMFPADYDDMVARERNRAEHRAAFPEQYAHPLCDKLVAVQHEGKEIARGTVERVVVSQFGALAVLAGDQKTAYAVAQCVEVA